MKQAASTSTAKASTAVSPDANRDWGRRLARGALNPFENAALSVERVLAVSDAIDLRALVDGLSNRADEIHDGNLKSGEAMLIGQAHCLDAIFHRFVSLAVTNLGSNVNAADTCLRLALKAQSQCRATIETLAEMKNPRPVAFVKQANIAAGAQQVNNGAQPEARLPRAGKTEIEPSGLLEVNDGKRLDTAAAGATTGIESAMETVGTVNGPANRRRKG
jgi:hypothetical protein